MAPTKRQTAPGNKFYCTIDTKKAHTTKKRREARANLTHEENNRKATKTDKVTVAPRRIAQGAQRDHRGHTLAAARNSHLETTRRKKTIHKSPHCAPSPHEMTTAPRESPCAACGPPRPLPSAIYVATSTQWCWWRTLALTDKQKTVARRGDQRATRRFPRALSFSIYINPSGSHSLVSLRKSRRGTTPDRLTQAGAVKTTRGQNTLVPLDRGQNRAQSPSERCSFKD